MSLIYYNSVDLFHTKSADTFEKYAKDFPSLTAFRSIFSVFAVNMTFFDRTGSIKGPIDMKLLDQCKMPKLQPFKEDYEELCRKRAIELLAHAKKTKRKLAILYSGGIDSTLILVTFLKYIDQKDLDEHVVVLLSEDSIYENPNFYKDHVVKRFKNIDPSYYFVHMMGGKNYIIVTGEGNDQLFGSAVMKKLSNSFGEEIFKRKITPELLSQLMSLDLKDKKHRDDIAAVLWKTKDKAPIPIDTVYKFFWWLNFTCKWQSVYIRVTAYTAPANRDTLKLEDNYFIFYGPEQFQLWAMNNSDKLIKNQWSTYKYVCKDIIYDFNKDQSYRDTKMKRGSLVKIVSQKKSVSCIDERMQFYESDFPSDIFTNDNDFADVRV